MQTMQHENIGKPQDSYLEIPSFEGIIDEDEKEAMLKKAREFIKIGYPKVDLKKLGPIEFGKKPGNKNTIVKLGPKGGETEIFKKDGSGFLFDFTKRNAKALGPEAESLIDQDKVDKSEIRRSIINETESEVRKAERIKTEKAKHVQNIKNLRIRIEKTKFKIQQLEQNQQLDPNIENEKEMRNNRQLLKNYETDLENEKKELAALEKLERKMVKEKKIKLDQLRARHAAKDSEQNTLEERLNSTKSLDDLNEQKDELQRKNEEDRVIIEDENTSPSEREAAEERMEERQEELARLNAQIEERERALPLRERIKEIFKNTVLRLPPSCLLLLSQFEQSFQLLQKL